jgi:hypothetical protein
MLIVLLKQSRQPSRPITSKFGNRSLNDSRVSGLNPGQCRLGVRFGSTSKRQAGGEHKS